MGKKRTIDTGRKDSLGRTIKKGDENIVPASQSQSSGSAKSDFSVEDIDSGEQIKDELSALRERIRDVKKVGAEELEPLHSEIDVLTEKIKKIVAKHSAEVGRARLEQIEALRELMEGNEKESLKDPEVMYHLVQIHHGDYDFLEPEYESDSTRELMEFSDDLYAKSLEECYWYQHGKVTVAVPSDIDSETLDREAEDLHEILQANKSAWEKVYEESDDDSNIQREQSFDIMEDTLARHGIYRIATVDDGYEVRHTSYGATAVIHSKSNMRDTLKFIQENCPYGSNRDDDDDDDYYDY